MAATYLSKASFRPKQKHKLDMVCPVRYSTSYDTIETYFSLSMEMSRLARDGTAEPVSRDRILRRERGQAKKKKTCSTDHEQDWQPYPVDLYSCYM